MSLHAAANNLVGFIKMGAVDKGSAIERKSDELVLRLLYRFRFGSSEQRAKSLGKKQGMDG